MKRRGWAAFGVVTLLTVAACSGADSGAEDPGEATTVAGDGEAVVIDGIDYAYAGVPTSVAAGTEISFNNTSTEEVHEAVIVKVADGEDRTIQELLELPEDESESLIEFQGVLVALPGQAAVSPETGESTVTVSDPGRYAIVCFIPQGADPAVVEEAMSSGSEEPPDMGDGTPHAFLGMAAEFTVEG